MPVTPSYAEYVLEQLRRVAPVATRLMFGGVGLYSRGLFFALVDDDRLYFKVDESNRPDFERKNMGPFRPFGDDTYSMHYYEVPGEVLEDLDQLGPWVTKAVSVARRKRAAAEAGRLPKLTGVTASRPGPRRAPSPKKKRKKVSAESRKPDKDHKKRHHKGKKKKKSKKKKKKK